MWTGNWLSWCWLDTGLSNRWYGLIAAVVAFTLLGYAIGWRSLTTRERALGGVAIAATASSLVVLHVLKLAWLRATGMLFVQGRYLLPLFLLHAAAIVTGLRAFGRCQATELLTP